VHVTKFLIVIVIDYNCGRRNSNLVVDISVNFESYKFEDEILRKIVGARKLVWLQK